VTAPFGVYVHIPFCSNRCDYCAFATWDDRSHLIDDYVGALVEETRRAELPPADTVFFGGGTPSLLRPEQLATVLSAVAPGPGAEVTVECNPETVTPDLLSGYRAAGVNRISLGVQSLSASVLHALGRRHRRDVVAPVAEMVSDAGFTNFNLDLIFGAAGETLEDWSETLRGAVDLGPTHISAYALTVEPGTPLAAAPDRHPDADLQADMYSVTDELLRAAGYQWYEISNWSRPGRECRHNLLYWRQGDYRGLGCAAHSHRSGRRWWNVRTPERYMRAVATGECVEAGSESLSLDARVSEALTLSLRTREGVPADAFDDVSELCAAGLVDVADGRASLTVRGRLLANEVAARLRG